MSRITRKTFKSSTSNSGAIRESDGALFMWGVGSDGRLGNNSTTSTSSPVQVAGNHSFVEISGYQLSNMARKEDGTVWCWGINSAGAIGDGTTTDRSSPTLVIGNHSFKEIVSGYFSSYGLKENGEIWSWGRNYVGDLGDNTTTDKSSPVQVVGGIKAQNIEAGGNGNFGFLDLDNNLWMCGNNEDGNSGNNSKISTSSPVMVVGGHKFERFSASYYNTAGLKSNGEVWTWGYNGWGQLGNQTLDDTSSPILVVGNHSFIEIALSTRGVCALKANGEVWSWGDNIYGNLGDNTTTPKSSPVLVVGNHSFIALKAGGHSDTVLAMKDDGSIWGWGNNIAGSLGDNTTTDKSSPVLVVGNFKFRQQNYFGRTFSNKVVASEAHHTVGIRKSGGVFAWGDNDRYQLGNGTVTGSASPIQVIGNHSFSYVSTAYDCTMALKPNGESWGWGFNYDGQIGDQTISDKSSPVQTVGGHSFIQTAVGGAYGSTRTIALKSNGEAWAWGNNGEGGAYGGFLGNNTKTNTSSPVLVVGNHSFIKVASSSTAGYGLKANGQIWAWGNGGQGELGNNTTNSVSSPVLVVGDHFFSDMATGYASNSLLALKPNGQVWGWGNNFTGCLGDGTTTWTSSPVLVVGNHSFVEVSNNQRVSLARKANGEVWAWGYNETGALGDNSLINRSSPVLVVGNHSFTELSSAPYGQFARKDNGEIWGWGINDGGQIGDNTYFQRSSPVMVVGGFNFSNLRPSQIKRRAITSSYNTYAIALLRSGQAIAWGLNSVGQLGNNTLDSTSSPVLVVGGHRFIEVSCGTSSSCGLKSNGEVWTWGSNSVGQLGDNTIISKSSPVLVVGNHSFIQISSSNSQNRGLKANGEIWSWGYGSDGAFGDNTTNINRSSPVLAVGGHSFIKISSGTSTCYGLKSNGEIWSFGYNYYGSLGDGTSTDKSSPVLVVGGHSFIDLSSSHGSYACYGLKSNGEVWSWGNGAYGMLGNNSNTDNQSSPVLVVGNHSFFEVASMGTHTMAFKENGEVWGWGKGYEGQLGNNSNTVAFSSPTLMVGNHSFQELSGSQYFSFGRKSNGEVWSWGQNTNGVLGDNTTTDKSSAVLVVGSFLVGNYEPPAAGASSDSPSYSPSASYSPSSSDSPSYSPSSSDSPSYSPSSSESPSESPSYSPSSSDSPSYSPSSSESPSYSPSSSDSPSDSPSYSPSSSDSPSASPSHSYDDVLIDSYTEENQNDGYIQYGISSHSYQAQSFYNEGYVLIDKAKFFLKKEGSPTGSIIARIYEHTGTYGINGTPTGSPLAISDEISATTLTGDYSLVTFTFTGANKIYLSSDTNYCIGVDFHGGNSSNYIVVGGDSSGTASGIASHTDDGVAWSIIGSDYDLIFYVYGQIAHSASYSPSSSESPSYSPSASYSPSSSESPSYSPSSSESPSYSPSSSNSPSYSPSSSESPSPSPVQLTDWMDLNGSGDLTGIWGSGGR